MPASAGRVHMPHNNRISTSGALATSDIWSKTIGHDPYAAKSEAGASGAAADEEKAKGLMALARHQKIAGDDTSGRDNFSQRLYMGLKRKKEGGRKAELETEVVEPDHYKLLQEQESSSEEEFIEVEDDSASDKNEKKRRKKKAKKRKRKKDYESNDDASSAQEEKKKEKKRKKERRRNYDQSSDESSSRDQRRRRKKKRRKRHRRRYQG
eukprot:CAMPEP_0178917548 /NCGR_PEP_ID=MMETSP0786-20121207/13307_1 /TAXON_ID=186022 /ORGANISM="Thalassionema frauenfeldii, Strain CCMP 1798" /LENGTH=209 /DNA_ID=CAMNT_0020591109 /DNA_START=156 /DNA_END=786 /DNA_ORIENTATION=+